MSLIFKILTLSLSVFLLNDLLEVEAQFANGIKFTVGKKQYYVETDDTGNFYQAANACTQLGMTLASIESKAEYKRIYSVLRNSDNLSNTYWLGGSSMGNNKVLYWLSTGKTIKYWTGDPITDADNQCLMIKDNNNSFEYDIGNCADSNNYICERNLEPYCGLLGQCRYVLE